MEGIEEGLEFHNYNLNCLFLNAKERRRRLVLILFIRNIRKEKKTKQSLQIKEENLNTLIYFTSKSVRLSNFKY